MRRSWKLVVVALPEELFFRGFLLGLLEKRFPPRRRLLGGGIGLALVLSSLAFAATRPRGCSSEAEQPAFNRQARVRLPAPAPWS